MELQRLESGLSSEAQEVPDKSRDVDTGLSGGVTFGKCMHFAQTKIIFCCDSIDFDKMFYLCQDRRMTK